ncbi:hypothetical protein ACH5RR_006544 [Cinchona calisaya]|uniref:Uncharacterized protein n=1 Tax=Cinchona calisaya TaxID=153742 RepID=A0ABD3APB6_9GENT
MAILVILKKEQVRGNRRKREKRFRFEAKQLKSKDCEKATLDSWTIDNMDNESGKIINLLENYRLGLTNWSKFSFKDVKRQTEALKRKIEMAQKHNIRGEAREDIRRWTIMPEDLLDK